MSKVVPLRSLAGKLSECKFSRKELEALSVRKPPHRESVPVRFKDTLGSVFIAKCVLPSKGIVSEFRLAGEQVSLDFSGTLVVEDKQGITVARVQAVVEGAVYLVSLFFKEHFSTEEGSYFKLDSVQLGSYRRVPAVNIESMNNVFQLGTAFDYEKLVLVMLSYILTR